MMAMANDTGTSTAQTLFGDITNAGNFRGLICDTADCGPDEDSAEFAALCGTPTRNLSLEHALSPIKSSPRMLHFSLEEENAMMTLATRLSPVRFRSGSQSQQTTPLKSTEAYSFMENLSPLPCSPAPMKSKHPMRSMLEDSPLGGSFRLDSESNFPMYRSPRTPDCSRGLPSNSTVASPSPRCSKTLDFSEPKDLEFGSPPFNNFSASPLNFPDFAPTNKPACNTPAKSPEENFTESKPYRSPHSFRVTIDPRSPIYLKKTTAEINNILRTPTPNQTKAPVKRSRKSSTPKRRRHRRSGAKQKSKSSRNSLGFLKRKRTLNTSGVGSVLPLSACNCKKSRCLKLYCECFAAMVMCNGCKCKNCQNTEEFAVIREEAIRVTRERNPQAFAPKINSKNGRHLKGCHCKKSGCKKKYCECFQAGIYCGVNCKCKQCENIDAQAKRHRPNDEMYVRFASKDVQVNQIKRKRKLKSTM